MRVYVLNGTAKSLPFWSVELQGLFFFHNVKVERHMGLPGRAWLGQTCLWGKGSLREKKKEELKGMNSSITQQLWFVSYEKGQFRGCSSLFGAVSCLALPTRRGREWHCVIRLLLVPCDANSLLSRREPRTRNKACICLAASVQDL